RPLLRVDRERRHHVVFSPGTTHSPPVVMHQHVVMSAQQYPVRDVGAAVIPFPLVDVMGLGPAGRAVRAGEPASAVAGREPDALAMGEQPLRSAYIDDLTVGVEFDRDDSRRA